MPKGPNADKPGPTVPLQVMTALRVVPKEKWSDPTTCEEANVMMI